MPAASNGPEPHREGTLMRFILNLPILVKLLMVMLTICVLPFLVLSAAEVLRLGGRPPTEVNFSALFVSLGLVLSFLSVGFLSRLIVVPLKQLQLWVQALAEGEELPCIEHKDEIGRLAGSFQRLMAQRKAAELRVLEKAELVRQLMNSTGEGIYSVDLAGCCTMVNPAALRMLGYQTPADLLGWNMHELILHTRADGEPYPLSQCWIQHALLTGDPVRVSDEVFWRRDGSSFPVEYSLYAVEREGAIRGAVINFHDISERKRLEQEKQMLLTQLMQSQKMEAVGQLAAGVAHDFNNILTAMTSFGELALQQVRGQEPARSYVQGVLDAVQRASTLTRSLSAFSRKQLVTPMVFNLNDHLTHFGTFLSRLVREDIELVVLPYREELPVYADAGQLELVLMNLVVNARDAMPGGGRVTLTCDLIVMDDEFILCHGFGKPGRFGLVSVEDNGIGMDSETREKVFEPFFTTKEAGKGTGLGLSMAYGIITHHGGFMKVDSEPGKGSSFQLYLPAVWPEPKSGAREAGYPRAWPRPARKAPNAASHLPESQRRGEWNQSPPGGPDQ